MIETYFFHYFEANVLLYVSKPQFLNFRLMPHLVVGRQETVSDGGFFVKGHSTQHSGLTGHFFLTETTVEIQVVRPTEVCGKV